jgi:methyl-accepting chemotaxis protein
MRHRSMAGKLYVGILAFMALLIGLGAWALHSMAAIQHGAEATEQSGQYASLRWVIFVFALASLALGGYVMWTVRSIAQTLRNTVAELAMAGDQVGSASGQIASTSQSLSHGASQQAASLEEISASMEEMTAMAKRNSENSVEATALMLETATQVERSNAALQEMVSSMGAIKASSEKVAKIIKTIDEIAFQTNILALNAAVEAARAGEAGMGFAVVADEVRNLAQRSAVAAKDTASLIEEAIHNTNQGAEKLEQVAVAIRTITEGAGNVKNLVDEVSESSKQQTQGIQQASTAVTQVSRVTQTAAASAEESAAASEELNAQAQSMRVLLDSLRVLVDGGSSASTSTPLPPPCRGHTQTSTISAAASKVEHDPFPMDTVGSGDFKNF